MVKLVILLLMGPFLKFDFSRYQCSSERFFFSLKIYGKLAGLSNKFEPSMVFDPSEFEGPRFDLYICNSLFPFFHGFFILYLKIWLNRLYIQNATQCTILRPSEKQFYVGGWGANPRPHTAVSLSRVGMYATRTPLMLLQKGKQRLFPPRRCEHDLIWKLCLDTSRPIRWLFLYCENTRQFWT
jgi:hypothetical protein